MEFFFNKYGVFLFFYKSLFNSINIFVLKKGLIVFLKYESFAKKKLEITLVRQK